MSAEALRAIGPDSIRPSRDSWRAAVSGGGGPVPHRAKMERAFGRDFSHVQTYVDRGGALDGLGANAATDGARVAFAAQSPSPRQVAHELAHVVQMRGRVAGGSGLSTPGSPAEREADRIADRAARGERVSVSETAPAALHRDIKADLQVPYGTFKIDMTKFETSKPGEDGQVYFKPNAKAPDSDIISLTQIVETKDLSSNTEFSWKTHVPKEGDRDSMRSVAGARVHITLGWETLNSISVKHFGSKDKATKIGSDNAKTIAPVAADALQDTRRKLPAGLSLQILDAVEGGYFVDHPADLADATKRAKASDPVVIQDYIRPSYAGTKNRTGHKKGTDILDAMISDYPSAGSYHMKFNFETVARSDDIGAYYGTLWWTFEADGTVAPTKVSKEDKGVKPGVTDTFGSAVVEFNRFYANPHTVMLGQTLSEISRLYFGKANKVDDIFKANAKLIGKRDAPLQVGWQLHIPGVTASDAK